ncbi:MAG: AraC family transcriptional regulator [Phycisphaerae bacterium]|nr:AraC family transcriptional regulator [Phycisphaerae bacterium]
MTQSTPLGRVTLTGTNRRSTHRISTMRRYESYAISYCFEGDGFYRDANGLDVTIKPGDMILVFPQLAHMYGSRRGQWWSEYYLCFEGPVFDLWVKNGLLDMARPVLHLSPVDYWLGQFQSVRSETRTAVFRPSILEVCRLQQVLAEAIWSQEIGAISPRDMDWVSRACALLEEDLEREKKMPSVAKKLGCSYEGFRKRFTRIVGISPAKYRDTRIIERACRLMQEQNLTNKEIAYRLGFCDEFHFSHRFKQIMGKSPQRFRRSIPSRMTDA